jgi:hypothetical protein
MTAKVRRAAMAAAALVLLAGFLHRPAFEHSLTRETDLALRVNIRHHHGQFVAERANILDGVHAFTVEL